MASQDEISEIAFDDSLTLRSLSLEIAQNGRRTIDIGSRHLDPAVYDNQPFVDALKDLVLRNRLARVRLLISDMAPVISRGHRLIDLASRLSSFIAVRKPGKDYKNFNEAMLVADKNAYTHRRFADRYDGIGSLDDIRRASVLSGQFDEIWERADLDPNFRRLHI
jgi:hypothetical protein